MTDPLSTSDTASQLAALETRLDRLRSGIVGEAGYDELEPPVGRISDLITPGFPEHLISRAALDVLPVPGDRSREGYHPRDPGRYWITGLADRDKVVGTCREFGIAGARLLDFGGSTGRLFRHFYCQGPEIEVWSSDLNVASFRWNQIYMPAAIRVLLNTALPPLPLPDRYFDVVTAFSVFTHIDQVEVPWLLELRRVLRPGGLLYLTIHDEAFWAQKPTQLLDVLRRSTNGEGLTSESPFPGLRTAFHFTRDSYYSCNVFHSREYVEHQWSRYFRILGVRPGASATGSQCVVLLTYDG